MRYNYLLSILATVSLLCYCQNAKTNQPNIIVMMVDDMGFSDPGCFGGEVQTPNLDRLANNGLRFTQFYNCSRCSPTRASLLTGKYAHEVGLHRNGRNLSSATPTLAEILRDNGYSTGMLGKWHLSKSMKLNQNNEDHLKWLNHQVDPGIPFTPDIKTYPINRGFDKHYGVIWGVVDFFDPFSLVNGEKAVKEVPGDYYITDAISDSAVSYINEFSNSKKPFFLYIAHTAPHWPLHAKEGDIAKYKGMYDEGWDVLRERRYQKQLEMGLFNEQTAPITGVMGGSDWNKLTPEQKKYQASKMMAHAAMIDCVDQGLGRIIAALEENNQFENTIIIFLSDNGASPEIPQAPGYDRPGMTRDGRKILYDKEMTGHAGPQTTFTGMGRSWANAANTPFRYWKKESFRGGNNTPCVVHWPAGLKAKPGSITNETTHVIDILPTCLELAELKYPQNFNGENISKPSGLSLLQTLKGEEREGHEFLFFEHENGRAIIHDNYKLVSKTKGHKHWNTFNSWELYDLSKDATETKNLEPENLEMVEKLSHQWKAWWDEYANLEKTK
ncbi:MAG: arylsulfatase [Bacteroidales bacterium]|nr:arylsulfatase [Bacteroidales bacterium]